MGDNWAFFFHTTQYLVDFTYIQSRAVFIQYAFFIVNALYTSKDTFNPLCSAGFNSVDQMSHFENIGRDSIEQYYSAIIALSGNIGSFNLEHKY